jgi:hypothetical protein
LNCLVDAYREQRDSIDNFLAKGIYGEGANNRPSLSKRFTGRKIVKKRYDLAVDGCIRLGTQESVGLPKLFSFGRRPL